MSFINRYRNSLKSGILSLFICLNISTYLSAEQIPLSVKGVVIDAEDRDPIPGAQVYLNGTTNGTTSNADGYFDLHISIPGIYELVVSSLGYESAVITLNTDAIESEYTFILSPKVYEMDEVVVKPDPERWQQDFELFAEIFIGEGPYSADTKIKNPEVLNFFFDDTERIFSAKATERLIIENKSLGYRIFYDLEYFIMDYAKGYNSYAGRPFFEPMESRRKRTRNKWKENRETAYYGSFQHFTQSMIDGTVQEDGYVVKKEQRKDDKRYLIDKEIPQSDFFSEYDRNTYRIDFNDFLNVTYLNEYEDESYLLAIQSPFNLNNRQLVDYQNSAFTLTTDTVLVDKSGYIFDPTAILYDGYWGFERISDLLPINYEPEK